jgi:DNA repair exonuclease SbcCD ATPase subunit
MIDWLKQNSANICHSKGPQFFGENVLTDEELLDKMQDGDVLHEYVLELATRFKAKCEELAKVREQLQNKAADKMPHSYVKMKWACGHTTGAMCDVCGTETQKELTRLRQELSGAQKEIERLTKDIEVGQGRENYNFREAQILRQQLREADEAIVKFNPVRYVWLGSQRCIHCGESCMVDKKKVIHKPTCIVLKSTERLKEK